MEQVPKTSPPRDARHYWTQAAYGLVAAGEEPRDSREFKLAYRLYILATLAMVEQDRPEPARAGGMGLDVDEANRRFHNGINQALSESGRLHEAPVFMEQDLSPADWNVIMAREIGSTLLFEGKRMPDSYLEILQAIEDDRCTMLLD